LVFGVFDRSLESHQENLVHAARIVTAPKRT
jgi:hypothetical protein